MADYTAFPTETGPPSSSPDASVNLGLEFEVTEAAWLKGVRFWRADVDQDGVIQCHVWQVTTASTGTLVPDTTATYTLTGTGWQDHLYPTPLPLVVGQRYRAAVLFPSGYSATGGWFGAGGPGEGGITNGPLFVPDAAAATGAFQGSFNYNGVPDYPDNGGTGNYWVTPIITDTDPDGGGETHDPGAGTAPLTLTAAGDGAKTTTATGAAGIVLAASGTASTHRAGAGAAPLRVDATGTGAKHATGAGVARLHLGAAGTGQARRVGSATAGLDLGAEGGGGHDGASAGAAGLALTAHGTGAHHGTGAGTAAFTLTAAGTVPAGTADITVTAALDPSRWAAALGYSRWTAGEVAR